MGLISAATPAIHRHRRVPLCGAMLAVAYMGSGVACAAAEVDQIKPELRLGMAIGPNVKNIDGDSVDDRRAYILSGGVFTCLPLNQAMGVVLGVGVPYRYGRSYMEQLSITSQSTGGLAAGGLSFHIGSIAVWESLAVFSGGYSRNTYEQNGVRWKDQGSFMDLTWQNNLFFQVTENIKLGASIGYDWFRQDLESLVDEESYTARGRGLTTGLVGVMNCDAISLKPMRIKNHLVYPEIRVGAAIGPSVKEVKGIKVDDKHAYVFSGGVYIDLPTNELVGVVLGVGVPYRHGRSNLVGQTLTSDSVGALAAGGLSFHFGGTTVLESLLVLSGGYSENVYSAVGYQYRDQGTFTDVTWQNNLLFQVSKNAKLGASLGYDWFKQQNLRAENGGSYEARGRGLTAGLVGAVNWEPIGNALSFEKKPTYPEIRLGLTVGPHIEAVQDVSSPNTGTVASGIYDQNVDDKRTYTVSGGVYVDMPMNSIVGTVLGLGIPYRFGTSTFSDGTELNTESLGGLAAGGLSFHLGSMVIIESLFVFSYGHTHASYSRESYHPNHYGTFTDYTWQNNLLIHESQGVKVGLSAGYDWNRMRLNDSNGDPYQASAAGVVAGVLGAITW